MTVINTNNFIDDGVSNIIETIKNHQSEFDLEIRGHNFYPSDVLFVPDTPSIAVEWAELVNSEHRAMRGDGAEHDLTNSYNIVYYQQEFSEELLFEKMRVSVDELIKLLLKYSNLDGYVHDRRTSVTAARPGIRRARLNGLFFSGVLSFRITKRKIIEF